MYLYTYCTLYQVLICVILRSELHWCHFWVLLYYVNMTSIALRLKMGIRCYDQIYSINRTVNNLCIRVLKICDIYRVDRIAFPSNESFKKISITYDDHCFIICMSNKKIHIVKKMLSSAVDHSSDSIAINA